MLFDKRAKQLMKGGLSNMRKGFTLVEIMIVVAIIALLAAIAIPNLLRARLNANDSAAKASLQALVTAIESYAAAKGEYPTDEDNLTIGQVDPPYLNESICDEDKQGYSFDCVFAGDKTGYAVFANATACNTSGSKWYKVETGNVWTDPYCQ